MVEPVSTKQGDHIQLKNPEEAVKQATLPVKEQGSKEMARLRRSVGRNRMIMLNIFKNVGYRRQALTIIGQLCRKYAAFAKSDMSLFEMFEKEKK